MLDTARFFFCDFLTNHIFLKYMFHICKDVNYTALK